MIDNQVTMFLFCKMTSNVSQLEKVRLIYLFCTRLSAHVTIIGMYVVYRQLVEAANSKYK